MAESKSLSKQFPISDFKKITKKEDYTDALRVKLMNWLAKVMGESGNHPSSAKLNCEADRLFEMFKQGNITDIKQIEFDLRGILALLDA